MKTKKIDLAVTHEPMGFCSACAQTKAGIEWVKENVETDSPRFFGIDDVRYAINITLGAIQAGLNVTVNGSEVYEGQDESGEPTVLVRQ